MSQYDIYLNGKGYFLAKDSKGGLLPGASREQIVDPFTQFLSRDEPYNRAPFRFGDGAGLHVHDGSHRYEWGQTVDARSGRLVLAPKRINTWIPYWNNIIHASSQLVAEQLDSGGSQYGIAVRHQVPASGYTTIRALHILVKRATAYIDYTSATTFEVGIKNESGGKPNTTLGSATIELKSETDRFSPFPDRWRNGDWFWLEVVFASDIVMTASQFFWIYVINAQTPEVLYWAEDQSSAQAYIRSEWNGTAWSTGHNDYPMMVKYSYKDGDKQFDSFVRCFQVYQGSDKVERMYAGTGYRILYYNAAWGTGAWWESKTIGVPVLQLLEFNDKLFAACGPDTDFWYSDGSVPTSAAWTQVTGFQSNAFAIHDNLIWKADERSVAASDTGLAAAWSATAVDVGDPGTPVQAMVSHGGKLYCAKPEGIFEITYPDTYPASGKPTSNLLLDFNTERYPRTWLLDWHSGLYFPGAGGVYELKSGILRNAWEDKIDEGALEFQETVPRKTPPWPYAKPRAWAPLYDKGPVGWVFAHPTTRGILCARTNPHTEASETLWYDGRNWFSLRPTGATTYLGEYEEYGEYITSCFVQDAGGGRGWLWMTEGTRLARTEWPTWTDDTVDDGTVDYEQFGVITTPWFSMPEQSREMLLAKVGLITENLGVSSRQVKVWYRYATSWISLGTFDTSPYEEIAFPVGARNTRRIQFKIMLDAGASSSTVSPIVEQLDLLYQVLPEVNKTHQLIIACAGDQALRAAGVDERTAGEVLADLRALVSSTGGFTYTDLLGADHTVRVTALTAQALNLHTGPGPAAMGLEYQVILNLLEV